MRSFLGFLGALLLGWTVFFVVILLCGYFLQGCGEKEPDFITSQGVYVFDPRGHTNQHDVELAIDCFSSVMYDIVEPQQLQGIHLYYVDHPETQCGKGTAACANGSYGDGWATIGWWGGLDRNATAHELLHVTQWNVNDCGRDDAHGCYPDPDGYSHFWRRLGTAKESGPNQATECYKIAKGYENAE